MLQSDLLITFDKRWIEYKFDLYIHIIKRCIAWWHETGNYYFVFISWEQF